jgi:hypothetical protein
VVSCRPLCAGFCELTAAGLYGIDRSAPVSPTASAPPKSSGPHFGSVHGLHHFGSVWTVPPDFKSGWIGTDQGSEEVSWEREGMLRSLGLQFTTRAWTVRRQPASARFSVEHLSIGHAALPASVNARITPLLQGAETAQKLNDDGVVACLGPACAR